MREAHPRTLLGIGFILAVAAAGVFLCFKKTHARGFALAAVVFEPSPDVTYLCDDHVPLDGDNVTFNCRATHSSGNSTTYRIVIDREGHVDAVPLVVDDL